MLPLQTSVDPTLMQVAEALGIVVAGAVLAWLILRGARALKRLARRTGTRLDDAVVAALGTPLALLVFLLSVTLALRQIPGARDALARYPGLDEAIVVLLATWVVVTLVRELVEVYGRPYVESTTSDFDDRLLGIVNLSATLVISLLGALLALASLGIEITPLLASLGVVGLAVALAVRTILANFFGGLVVTADPTIQVGHRIRVGEFVGDVVAIGRYKTTLRTRDNLLVSYPNEKLMSETVVNYNLPNAVSRVECRVSVAYGSDLDLATSLVRKIAAEIPGLDPSREPEVNVVGLADSAVELQVLLWQTVPRGARRTRDRLYREVLRRFPQAGIAIPFPQLDVSLRHGGEGGDGGDGGAADREPAGPDLPA